jgi:hypothetical protein
LIEYATWNDDFFVQKKPHLINHWGKHLFEGPWHVKSLGFRPLHFYCYIISVIIDQFIICNYTICLLYIYIKETHLNDCIILCIWCIIIWGCPLK